MIQVIRVKNEMFSSNTFIVLSKNISICWLVDIGNVDIVLQSIPNGKSVKGVILTHTHFDHIYGINDLLTVFPALEVCTSEYGKESLYSEKKNFSFYHDNPIVYTGQNVRTFYDGNKIEIFPGVFAHVYETPGHCPSSLTYVIGSFIFTGDSYIPNNSVVSKLPRGNKRLAQESELRIKELAIGKNIMPGHGECVFQI